MPNSLSRHLDRLPTWIIQSIVGVFLSCLVTWTTWASLAVQRHETRVTVVESNISDIKESQKQTNQKLDRLIEMHMYNRGGK